MSEPKLTNPAPILTHRGPWPCGLTGHSRVMAVEISQLLLWAAEEDGVDAVRRIIHQLKEAGHGADKLTDQVMVRWPDSVGVCRPDSNMMIVRANSVDDDGEGPEAQPGRYGEVYDMHVFDEEDIPTDLWPYDN